MTEEPKRNLRARKNPKYLNSDEQDPDKVSFSQLKSHHDYSSANSQKAQDAKIFAKFINKINKNYRTYRTQVAPSSIEVGKSQNISKDKKVENLVQTGKKGSLAQKESKTDTGKKNKQMYNFKGQSSIKDSQTLKNTESYIKKLKQMGSIPNISGMGKDLYTDQLKKLQSLYPDMKNIQYQSLNQHTNPHLFSGPPPPKKQTAPLPRYKQVYGDEQKLFKRSAYHIAIAYHIYLKNLKEKGGVIGNEIDPTYYAKRLKEGRPLE